MTAMLSAHGVATPPDVLLTGEDLLQHPEWGRCELVRGKVVKMCRPNPMHGRLAVKLANTLDTFVDARRLGMVFSETGVYTERGPDSVRGPDIFYVRAENCPAPESWTEYFQTAPDLCIEIVSPSDRWLDLNTKIEEYLKAGVKLVWLIEPESQSARVYRADRAPIAILSSGVLSGEDVLPSFELPLAELFAAVRLT